MAIVPYDPFRQLTSMKKDFDRMFSEFPLSSDTWHHVSGIRVDVHETENEVIATCDIPGIEKKEDITIDIEQNLLTISGTINKINDIKEEHMYRKERYVGSFHRSISLPSPVSEEGAKASYRNGVLEVTMVKFMQDHKKKIDVDFH